ncbi:MAG: hypothetical protein IJH12_05690 [Clostridia bacterium]|nr:hypothetical protein [Clostridia bacterium]
MKNLFKYLLIVIVTAAIVTGVWFVIKGFNKKNSENVSAADANKEIAKALKDEEWLEEKGLKNDKWAEKQAKESASNEAVGQNQTYNDLYNFYLNIYKTKLYFTKISDVDGMPAYLVKQHMMDSEHTYLVTYKNGEVVVSKNHAGNDYAAETVDIDKNIIEAENVSAGNVTYYKVEGNDIVEIEGFEPDQSDEARKKYKDYNFVEIDTELTSSNVDKYVK